MFSGNVSIHVTSLKERDHFLVHSKFLEILASNIKKGHEEIDLVEVLPMEHKKHEFLVFRTKGAVSPGNYTINISMYNRLGILLFSYLVDAIPINVYSLPLFY